MKLALEIIAAYVLVGLLVVYVMNLIVPDAFCSPSSDKLVTALSALVMGLGWPMWMMIGAIVGALSLLDKICSLMGEDTPMPEPLKQEWVEDFTVEGPNGTKTVTYRRK